MFFHILESKTGAFAALHLDEDGFQSRTNLGKILDLLGYLLDFQISLSSRS